MAKWYVRSGQVHGIVSAATFDDACRQVLHRSEIDPSQLSVITTVSESGFAIGEATIVMLTSQILGDRLAAERS